MAAGIVAGLPRGEHLSVEYVKAEVRRVTGAVPSTAKSKPRGGGGVWLITRLIKSLLLQSRPARIAMVIELMTALGLVVGDLAVGAQACQHQARHLTAPVQAEQRAVA